MRSSNMSENTEISSPLSLALLLSQNYILDLPLEVYMKTVPETMHLRIKKFEVNATWKKKREHSHLYMQHSTYTHLQSNPNYTEQMVQFSTLAIGIYIHIQDDQWCKRQPDASFRKSHVYLYNQYRLIKLNFFTRTFPSNICAQRAQFWGRLFRKSRSNQNTVLHKVRTKRKRELAGSLPGDDWE